MNRVEIIFILFFTCIWNLKFNPTYLHHDFGKRKRKVKESAKKTREVGDQSAHSSSG
jgi:hypothetical protein